MRSSNILSFIALSALIACSSTPDQQIVMLPTAGSGNVQPGGGTDTGGAGITTGGGGGGAGPIAGSAPEGGVNSGGSGGSTPDLGGSGGSGDVGGSSGSGGGGGGGGAGGSGEDPNKKVLFDGSAETFSGWKSVRPNVVGNPWKNNGDGTMTVAQNTGDIQSTLAFNDVFVHLEYMSPRWVTAPSDDQQRANSGVYMKGSYEVQILNTFGMAPANDRCGAIYGVRAPLETACFDAEEWNIYEIEFKAQTCNGNQKTGNARFIEVKLNGKVVQTNVDVPTTTQAGQPETCDPKGILLQDHATVVPVTFRNIWVIPRN